jgi:hypothetical protein
VIGLDASVERVVVPIRAQHKLSLAESDVALVLRIACGEDDTAVLPLDEWMTATVSRLFHAASTCV